ncbi:MAG: type II secretion system protein [bacterium]
MDKKSWSKNFKDKQKGFTLLEVLVALGILGIIVTGVFLGFSHGFAVSSNTRKRLKAMDIAMSNLDRAVQLVSTSFSSINDTGNTPINCATDNRFYSESGCNATIIVKETSVLGEVNCKRINSSVDWNDAQQKRSHTISFDTAVYWISEAAK